MILNRIAASRFGLGARLDEDIPADGKRALLDQFGRYDPRPAAFSNIPSRETIAAGLADYLQSVRDLRKQMSLSMPPRLPGGTQPGAMEPAIGAAPKKFVDPAVKSEIQLARKALRDDSRGNYQALIGARANAALDAPAPFVERLVYFWANHFAVSADKQDVVGMAGLLEIEAVRPHVLGKFSDMLLAVEHHPAMLLYLDQAQSIGPNSVVGVRAAGRGNRKPGLNENLAREIMELHTLGVRTGYDQADVTEFARAMTGWSVAGLGRQGNARFNGTEGRTGDFVFAAPLHEPGARTIMGRHYAEGGEAQARAVLLDLAASPATAHHIATKLARQFAGDAPPPALVMRLSDSFLHTGGDLPSLYRVLIDAPELWTVRPAKFKSPWDWSVSAMRAVGTREVDGKAVEGLQVQLGQPVWKPGSPAGYDDIDATWAGPDALMRRVEAASRIAARAGNTVDARKIAAAVLPGGGSPATLAAIARAESPVDGLALLLVAPEFMRR